MKTNNPVLQREYLCQQRSTPFPMRIVDSVGIVAVVLCLMLLLAWITRAEIASMNSLYIADLLQWGQVSTWIILGLTVIRAILAGVATTSRDAGNPRLDDLKLAGISPSEFLIGKWRAACYQLRGWVLALGLLRLAFIGLLMGRYLVNIYHERMVNCVSAIAHYSDYGRCSIETNYLFVGWQKWAPLFIPGSLGSTIVLSLLEVMASTAIGTALSLLMRKSWISLAVALIVRFLPIVCFSLWPSHYSSTYSIPWFQVWTWRWYQYTWFSLADGGMTGVLRMANTPGWYGMNCCQQSEAIPPALAAGAGMLILFWGGAMFVGWLALRFNGFLPKRSEE